VIKGTQVLPFCKELTSSPWQDTLQEPGQEWGQANGVTMSADFLNWPDLQPEDLCGHSGGGVDIVEYAGMELSLQDTPGRHDAGSRGVRQAGRRL